MFLFFINYLFKNKKDKILLFLLLFFLANSLLAIYGAKLDYVMGRYALIPGVLLIFVIYRIFQISSGFMKFLSISLVLMSLLTGLYEYKFNNLYPEFLACIECPDWKSEVAKWRIDKTYDLKIWAYPERTMSLNY